MIPGPKFIYQCPHCDNLFSRGSLMSGNTSGMRSYSDGKRVAPMLPQFPSLTICSKCRVKFWIRDAQKIGEYIWGEEIPWQWAGAEEATFLTIYEYSEAIEQQVAQNEIDERYIRIRIWRGFNDRVRAGQSLFTSDTDNILWTDNIEKLLEMLDPSIDDQRIIMAELYRNLGHFDRCLELLDDIDAPELSRLKEAFKKECEKKNQAVFELN